MEFSRGSREFILYVWKRLDEFSWMFGINKFGIYCILVVFFICNVLEDYL